MQVQDGDHATFTTLTLSDTVPMDKRWGQALPVSMKADAEHPVSVAFSHFGADDLGPSGAVYRAPEHFRDAVDATTWVARFFAMSLDFDYAVICDPHA